MKPAMRAAHRGTSRRAVAGVVHWAYPTGMNAKQFPPLRPPPALTGTDLHMSRPHDLHAVTKKALDRWENEGGKIPEGSSNDHTFGVRPARVKPAPAAQSQRLYLKTK